MTIYLGTRLVQIATGGAATSPQVFAFMNDCFRCSAVDAYGTTEVCFLCSCYLSSRHFRYCPPGHQVPGVATDGEIPSTVTVKLRDVPEMGYLSTDKPHPRGGKKTKRNRLQNLCPLPQNDPLSVDLHILLPPFRDLRAHSNHDPWLLSPARLQCCFISGDPSELIQQQQPAWVARIRA